MHRAPLSFEAYQSTKYFPALDGLRAISCLFVITWHAEFLGWSVLNGHAGVTIFFVLSGYLITTLALREEEKRGKLSLKAFYLRRTFRIFPAYYCVLVAYCVLIFGVDIASSIERRGPLTLALPYYLFYLNEYTSGPALAHFGQLPPFFHSWSLGIEEKFYLIWPFLGFVLIRHNPVARVAVLSLILAVHFGFHDYAISQVPRLHMYRNILIGCILAVLMERRSSYAILVNLAVPWVNLALFAVLLLTQFGMEHDADNAFTIAYPIVVAMFLVGLVAGRTPCTTLFKTRLLNHLGLRTYGMYLVHLLAQNAVELVLKPGVSVPAWKAPLLFLACATVTVIGAEILYHVVERPCTEYGRRLSKKMLDTPAA